LNRAIAFPAPEAPAGTILAIVPPFHFVEMDRRGTSVLARFAVGYLIPSFAERKKSIDGLSRSERALSMPTCLGSPWSVKQSDTSNDENYSLAGLARAAQLLLVR
jgi:hypothetical protein